MKLFKPFIFLLLFAIANTGFSEVKTATYSMTEDALHKEVVRGTPELFVYDSDHSLVFTSKGFFDDSTFSKQMERALFERNEGQAITLDEFRKGDSKHLERYLDAMTKSIANSSRYPEDQKPMILKSSIELAETSYTSYDPSFSAISKKIDGKSDLLKDNKEIDFVIVRYFSSMCEPCKKQEKQLNAFVKRHAKKYDFVVVDIDRTPKMNVARKPQQ